MMVERLMKPFGVFMVLFSIIPLILVACGGGGGGGATPPPDTSYTVNGVASKGLIRNGTVNLYAIDADGAKETPALATTTTDSAGAYSATIDYNGALLVEVGGGTYTDEATGTETALIGVLRTAIAEVSGPSNIAISPLTELAVRRAEVGGNLLLGHISAANAMVSQLVDCDITSTLPLDPQNSQVFADGSTGEQNYTLMLAALSQMVAIDDYEDIDAVMEAIEADLDDSVLDDTGPVLSQALEDFLEGEHNETGADEALTLQNLLTAAADGLTPTGDLAEAERLLAAFFSAGDEERQAAFDELDSYLNSFVADTKEAHLYAALGTLMKVYSIDSADLIKTDLGIDFQTDFEVTDEAFVLDRLLQLANYDGDVGLLLAGIVTQLDTAIDDLAGAQGIDTIIALTGFDSIRIDDIDLQILTTFATLMRAACLYIQSVDLAVTDWQVPLEGGGTMDARDLIGTEEDLTETQALALMENNSDLFIYKDVITRNDAIVALKAAIADYQALMSDLENLGAEARRDRTRNAFSLETEMGFWTLKGIADQTLPAVLAAIDSPTAPLKSVESDERCESIEVADDGFAYPTEYGDLFVETYEPNSILSGDQAHTVYSVLGDVQGLRNLVNTWIPLGDSFEPYILKDRTAYRTNVSEVDWEEPIDTYTIPEAAITIDGSGGDWEAVPVFKALGDVTVKIARNDSGYYMHIARRGGLVTGDFSQLSVGLGMFNWDGCYGESGAYRLNLYISEWEGTPSVYGSDDYDSVDPSAYRWISPDSTVTGLEFSSAHLTSITQRGGWNYIFIDLEKDTPNAAEGRFWGVKLLPESDN
jgi:hypothetical protein